MPYIERIRRPHYDQWLEELIEELAHRDFNPGDVTYVVYRIVLEWFNHARKYSTICSIRGMLTGVLSEFDRREAFFYEDKKIVENGDVKLYGDGSDN